MKQENLIDEIERFLAQTGMEPTMFGHRVNREWRLVDRLRAGGDVTTRTADKIRTYIAENTPRQRPKRSRSAAHA